MSTSASSLERPVAGPLRHLLSILALPFMNTVVLPAAILSLTGSSGMLDRLAGHSGIGGIAAIVTGGVFLGIGLLLVVTSIGLFAARGEGTLAPWDPPRKLVVTGPYRFVRNPMKTGLIFVLMAETLLLRSAPLGLWCAIFSVVNVLYIRLSEEPGLRRRFGAAYDEYCAAVPAWVPRLTPAEQRGS